MGEGLKVWIVGVDGDQRCLALPDDTRAYDMIVAEMRPDDRSMVIDVDSGGSGGSIFTQMVERDETMHRMVETFTVVPPEKPIPRMYHISSAVMSVAGMAAPPMEPAFFTDVRGVSFEPVYTVRDSLRDRTRDAARALSRSGRKGGRR